jgi:hypothetical protein
MYYRSKKATLTQVLSDAMLAALGARPAAALLTTPTVLLYTAGPVPLPGMVVGSYTEATFHGYAAAAITLVGPVTLGGTDRGVVGSVTFVATTGGTISDTCIGYLLVDTTKAIVYDGEQFTTPISFGAAGDFLDLDFILPLPQVYTPVVV